MSDDIEEAKRVSFSIIDRRRGTPEEPSEYILVPFNDPGSHMAYLVIYIYIYIIYAVYQCFPQTLTLFAVEPPPGEFTGIYNFKIKNYQYSRV